MYTKTTDNSRSLYPALDPRAAFLLRQRIRAFGLDPEEFDLGHVAANARAFMEGDPLRSPSYAYAKALGQLCPESAAEMRLTAA